MSGEQRGPEPTGQLGPPGFLALNYGRRAPLSAIAAQLLYRTFLGAYYHLQ